MARKTISQWIQEAFTDPDKTGKVSRFTLVHKVGVGDDEVHTTRLDAGGRQWTAEELGGMFDGKARVFCQDMQGVQTFQLRAYYGTASEPEAKYTFLVNVSPEMFSSGLATEAPTNEGRMQQKMRHDEMLMQQVYRRQQQLDDHSLRLIDVLSNRVTGLMSENADAFNIVKELIAARETRQHEITMKQLEFMRSSEERKVFLRFLPPLLNQVIGREVFPVGTEDTALIEAAAEAISPDDFMKLAAVIKKPELMGPLGARFEQILKQKMADQEEAQRTALALATDGEAEAAGEPHGQLTAPNANGKALQ